MYDLNSNPQPRRSGWLPKVVIAVALVAALVVGASFGPMAWHNATALATAPAATAPTPLKLVDSSMLEDQAA